MVLHSSLTVVHRWTQLVRGWPPMATQWNAFVAHMDWAEVLELKHTKQNREKNRYKPFSIDYMALSLRFVRYSTHLNNFWVDSTMPLMPVVPPFRMMSYFVGPMAMTWEIRTPLACWQTIDWFSSDVECLSIRNRSWSRCSILRRLGISLRIISARMKSVVEIGRDAMQQWIHRERER